MRFGPRVVIFVIVLFLVPVASWYYVFKPRNAEITQKQQEIQVKQATLEKLRKVSEQIQNTDHAIEQGQVLIDMLEAKLPSAKDVEVILQDVWQLAARDRLEVKSVKSEKPVSAAGYMEQPLRVEMLGTFDGFYEFLLGLENLPRITRIHELKMERVGTGRDDVQQGLMKVEFTLSIYFEPSGLDSE